nr:hypothetical protein [Candidatus Sigynarchaeota archaeon]
MEAIIGIFGSRFEFNFRPRESKIDHSGLGRFYDEAMEFALGIDVEGETEALPFTKSYKHFPATFMSQTMNTISYSGQSNDFLAEVRVTFNAHFYPKDELLSTLPVFIIDVDMRKLPTKMFAENVEGNLFLKISRKDATANTNSSKGCTLAYKADGLRVQDEIIAIDAGKHAIPAKIESSVATILDVPYSVGDEWTRMATIFWGSYVGESVLDTKRGKVTFAYTKHFKSAMNAVTHAM